MKTALVLSARATANRIERGLRLYEANLVRSVGNDSYVVASESSNLYYIVSPRGCTCPDARERQMLCKHVWACHIGAILTIWRIQEATSRSEIESLAALRFNGAPIGIIRTIYSECEKAFERLSA
jgi:hypothetical protein